MEKPGAQDTVVVAYQDYLQFPDDGKRYEVIDGEVFVTPAPSPRHQGCLVNLTVLLATHVKARKLGRVLVAPCDVVLDPTNVVQPDLLFVSKANDIIGPTCVRGAPDLVVENLSPSNEVYDRKRKFKSYESHGVPHYWILDPTKQTLEEYVLVEAAYRLTAKVDGPGEFRPRIFPELVLDLAEVWSE